MPNLSGGGSHSSGDTAGGGTSTTGAETDSAGGSGTGSISTETSDGETSDTPVTTSPTASTGSTGSPDSGTSSGGVDQIPFELSEVEWLHEDVSGWDEGVVLSDVTFGNGEICLHHNIADQEPPWPTGFIGMTEVIGNAWIFIHQDDQWYGATWEWLRPPGQICKFVTAVAGDHIKVPPFDEASEWVPTSGETYYFMVSGFARAGLSNVEVRSNLYEVVWP